MTQLENPVVETRFACIASQAGLALAAIISSYFDEPARYFAVFEYPTLDFPSTGSIDSDSDGYFSRVLGEKAATEINNALARVQPDVILLVGISEAGQTYIRSRMPEDRLVEVNGIEDFLSRIGADVAAKESLSCKPSQVAEGLLFAKSTGKALLVDEQAPDLPNNAIRGRRGIVVVEGGNDVHDLVAINYAAAFDLDAVIIAGLDRETIRTLPQILAKWSDDNSYFEFKLFERKALRPLRGIDFSHYEFATFFTLGVPYGLFLKNIVPFSHVWKHVDCGVFIVINLMDDDVRVPSDLLSISHRSSFPRRRPPMSSGYFLRTTSSPRRSLARTQRPVTSPILLVITLTTFSTFALTVGRPRGA
jgi:hypothetical protein